MLTLTLEPSISMDCTSISWQHVCLPLKSYVIVDVDDQVVALCHYRVMLAMEPPRRLGHGMMSMSSHASDGVAKATWPWCDVVTESC
jgi:hypothetical protein